MNAMIMLKRYNNKRFGDLKRRLQEGSDVGRDEYSTTVEGAYDLLVRTQEQIRSLYSNKGYKKSRVETEPRLCLLRLMIQL